MDMAVVVVGEVKAAGRSGMLGTDDDDVVGAGGEVDGRGG